MECGDTRNKTRRDLDKQEKGAEQRQRQNRQNRRHRTLSSLRRGEGRRSSQTSLAVDPFRAKVFYRPAVSQNLLQETWD